MERAWSVQGDAGKHATQETGEHGSPGWDAGHSSANAGVWNVEDLPIEKMTEKQWTT